MQFINGDMSAEEVQELGTWMMNPYSIEPKYWVGALLVKIAGQAIFDELLLGVFKAMDYKQLPSRIPEPISPG